MKPTIYIAGPMRGLPNFNREAFDAAAERLGKDWHPLNPVYFEHMLPCELSNGIAYSKRLNALMAIELEAVRQADAIYLLKGWEKSYGAKRELAAYLSSHDGGEILLEGRE